MRYVAGLDGGGTKTAVTIADERGAVVRTFTAGPLNGNGLSDESVRAAVLAICGEIAEACSTLDACAHICVGAAGISNPAASGRLMEYLREGGYASEVLLVGDHETALCGAHGGLNGMILIAGTGSICYGRVASGISHRAGGFGHLIDDEGSGYSIGRELLSAIVRAEDGRLPATRIKKLVFDRLQMSSVQELVGYVYAKERSKGEIAAIAPLLSEACDAEDEAALGIVERSAEALTELASAVIGRLGLSQGELALAGSVLVHNRYVRDAFVERLASRHPEVRCISARHDAAYGAVLLALDGLKEGK
ncbi:ATPase [Paenibacillus sp. J5C_2022]|uniref:N-acetylglucosamine kinase n=1 Tax=Paenibacillus sp. J5C2022 TaxID=2977129 RepID=UPI0021CE17A9|nr:BadF/BadG/BcrA/BcrD ATPase family protein [Paenibacillus sp. J5C2022]MCU6708618.1 ATPase [Paenibacillus sp. J5C2022]